MWQLTRSPLVRLDCDGVSVPARGDDVHRDQFLAAGLAHALDVQRTSLPRDHAAELATGEAAPPDVQLLVVAGGVGDEPSARRASTIVVEDLARHLLERADRLDGGNGQDDLVGVLTSGLHRTHEHMLREAARSEADSDLCSTATAVCIRWPRLDLVHAGDSRCYLQRSMRLKRLTSDHTVASKLAEAGILDLSNLQHSRWSNVLSNAVGVQVDRLEPEVAREELRGGDTLLLCTDGLTRHLDDDAIARCLRETGSAAESCRRLVAAARDAGAVESMTLIVARLRMGHESGSQDGLASPDHSGGDAPRSDPDFLR